MSNSARGITNLHSNNFNQSNALKRIDRHNGQGRKCRMLKKRQNLDDDGKQTSSGNQNLSDNDEVMTDISIEPITT